MTDLKDSVAVSALYGRIMVGILGLATVALTQMGVDVSPEDSQVIIDSGQDVINAGYILAAKITAASGAILALVSKFRESKRA